MEGAKKILQIIGAVLIIALAARVKFDIPGTQVPFTLQSLVILLMPIFLGKRWGSAAVLCYVLLGLAGLPIFSGGSAGLDKIWGPTGGFIVGFPIAAWVVGYLADRLRLERYSSGFVCLLVGHFVLWVPGFVWLERCGLHDELWRILNSLIPGLLLKTVIGAGMIVLWEKWRKSNSYTRFLNSFSRS